MIESKGFNISRITRVLLLITTFILFIAFFFLFNSSYHQYENIEDKTKNILQTFKESQENIDTIYNKFNEAQQHFVMFSKSLNPKDYSEYEKRLYNFKTVIDSLVTTRKEIIKKEEQKNLKIEQDKKILNYFLLISSNLDSTIIFKETLEKNSIANPSLATFNTIKNILLSYNVNVLYEINQVIRTLNHDLLQLKRDIIENESKVIFEESNQFRVKTFLCLIFIFILICIIIYYQFFSSYYKRKLTNEKLYARKLAEKKSDIFTEIAHEIRTPINSLIGIIEILKKKKNLYNEEDRLLVESAYTSITNTSNIINDILNQNTKKDASNNYHSFDIEEIVSDIIDLHQSEAKIKHLKLEYSLDNDSPTIIFTDEYKIRQIINNLIANAIKYSNEGTVSCGIEILDTSILKIRIKDEGIGIPIDVQQNIFKRYFTAEIDDKYSSGLGLGLYITKKLVNSLNGKIAIQSIIAKGTVFTVEIPIPIAKHKASEPHQYTTLNDLPYQLSWLIVDDNALNLLYLKQFFAKFPNTYSANNGMEALEIISKQKIDIIITDINMPIMTGDELLVKIKENVLYNHIKVIATSSDNQQVKKLEIINNCYFDGILTKPFNEKDLLKTIVNTLNIK